MQKYIGSYINFDSFIWILLTCYARKFWGVYFNVRKCYCPHFKFKFLTFLSYYVGSTEESDATLCVQSDIVSTQNETVELNTIQSSEIFHLFKMNL